MIAESQMTYKNELCLRESYKPINNYCQSLFKNR